MITTHKQKSFTGNKKKPPPRPPPPNFSKYKSKSTLNLAQQKDNNISLIEWSPPSSPKVDNHRHFGGSVSSSFSSSTSSLASSKKSFEYEPPITNNLWPTQNHSTGNSTFYHGSATRQVETITRQNASTSNVTNPFGPTIIRAQASKKTVLRNRAGDITPPSPTLPMPTVPPPSPPKEVLEIETPYGIALYDFTPTQPTDLSMQTNDVVILLRRINNDWLYGKILDKEGMFPANFIDIKVPLKEDESFVTALYEFRPEMPEDLELKPGQRIHVIRKISNDWLYGEYNGKYGQFPSNFVDRIPKNV